MQTKKEWVLCRFIILGFCNILLKTNTNFNWSYVLLSGGFVESRLTVNTFTERLFEMLTILEVTSIPNDFTPKFLFS